MALVQADPGANATVRILENDLLLWASVFSLIKWLC